MICELQKKKNNSNFIFVGDNANSMIIRYTITKGANILTCDSQIILFKHQKVS